MFESCGKKKRGHGFVSNDSVLHQSAKKPKSVLAIDHSPSQNVLVEVVVQPHQKP